MTILIECCAVIFQFNSVCNCNVMYNTSLSNGNIWIRLGHNISVVIK